MDLGIRGGIRLAGSVDKPLPTLPRSNSSLIPFTHLQHPGCYFYLAGLCAIERKRLYDQVAKSLEGAEGDSTEDAATHELVQSTTWAHEVTVDHTEGVIEVSEPYIDTLRPLCSCTLVLNLQPLSHAYQAFKKNRSERTSLVIALRIAAVHVEAGHLELALK